MNWCICNLLFFMALSLWQIIYGAIFYFHSTQSLVGSILLNTCFPATKEKLKIFFGNKFPGLFQDSDWFFQHLKIHINPFTLKITILILLTVCHTLNVFLLQLKRFPELSRTSSLFPGLSSPKKCHNKIPGLPRISRTCAPSIASQN